MAAETSPWEDVVGEFERQDAVGQVPPGRILFVGSSTFTRWNLAEYFPRRDLVNRGFGGSKLYEVADLAPRYVVPPRPRQIVLYAGDNDLGLGRTPQQVLDSYRQFLAVVRPALPATSILFVSVKPSPIRRHLLGAMRETNRLVIDEIRRRSDARLEYLDVFAPMLDAAGEPRRELFVEDQLHLSHEGYLLWAKIIGPQLQSEEQPV
jgi:lysophospholipase L1-like esterase